MAETGATIAGRYRVDHEIGAGAMGAVYRALDALTSEPVAVKILHRDTRGPRFEREGRVLAALGALSHPAIVRYVDHGTTDDGRRFLVTEWLEGEDLSRRLARAPLRVGEALALAQRVAEALAASHAASVVHRDVKPSNIFLLERDVAKAKLIDFGVARARDTYRTATGAVVGTLSYMAPEQARGDRDVDGRADLFALGCVLYECITGARPFAAATPLEVRLKIVREEPPRLAALRPDLPPIVDALVHRMLAKDPSLRLPEALAAAAMLAGLRTVDGPPPRPAVAITDVDDASLTATSPDSRRR